MREEFWMAKLQYICTNESTLPWKIFKWVSFTHFCFPLRLQFLHYSFWNPVELLIFIAFQSHFKIFWYGSLIEMRGIFCVCLFWGTAKWQLNWWHSIIWVIIWVAILVSSRAKRLKCKCTRKWKGMKGIRKRCRWNPSMWF